MTKYVVTLKRTWAEYVQVVVEADGQALAETAAMNLVEADPDSDQFDWSGPIDSSGPEVFEVEAMK